MLVLIRMSFWPRHIFHQCIKYKCVHIKDASNASDFYVVHSMVQQKLKWISSKSVRLDERMWVLKSKS